MTELTWVVLTMGDRPDALATAIGSIRAQDVGSRIIVVENGGTATGLEPGPDLSVVSTDQNIGIPAGRDLGVTAATTEVVAFLDDDAQLDRPDSSARIVDTFDRHRSVGAVALRITDPRGRTERRHIPRLGRRSPAVGGDVATFLGGACAVRRSDYSRAGGYWGELFYAHEELDLSWRLHDVGADVRYLADVTVTHPPGDIGENPQRWWYTGRNRVMVVRRNLPWIVGVVHLTFWIVVGLLRAPGTPCRRSYLAGWVAGCRQPVRRRPIAWRTVVTLSRRGRPPVV